MSVKKCEFRGFIGGELQSRPHVIWWTCNRHQTLEVAGATLLSNGLDAQIEGETPTSHSCQPLKSRRFRRVEALDRDAVTADDFVIPQHIERIRARFVREHIHVR